MVVLLFILLGFGLIGCDVWAFIARRSLLNATQRSSRYRFLNLTSWTVGCVLAATAVTVWWPYSHDVRIVGFPFPAVVFERSGDDWLDFVGPLSLPALLADFVICLILPQFVLTVYLRATARTPAPPIRPAPSNT